MTWTPASSPFLDVVIKVVVAVKLFPEVILEGDGDDDDDAADDEGDDDANEPDVDTVVEKNRLQFFRRTNKYNIHLNNFVLEQINFTNVFGIKGRSAFALTIFDANHGYSIWQNCTKIWHMEQKLDFKICRKISGQMRENRTASFVLFTLLWQLGTLRKLIGEPQQLQEQLQKPMQLSLLQ